MYNHLGVENIEPATDGQCWEQSGEEAGLFSAVITTTIHQCCEIARRNHTNAITPTYYYTINIIFNHRLHQIRNDNDHLNRALLNYIHSTIYKRFPTIDNMFNRRNMNYNNVDIGLGRIRIGNTRSSQTG